MTDAVQAKSFWDYHEEIEALKLERIAAWREQMPDDVNAHIEGDEAGAKYAQKAARAGENHPDVVALEVRIRQLRAEQLDAHDEPSEDEWNAYHAAQAEKG